MKRKAVLIVNPSSGKEQARAYTEEAVKELQKVYEEVEVKETKGPGDAKAFAKEASEEEVSLVISMGGDGTVHEVVNGLSENEVRPALGIIPLGTVNDLARALGIPLQPEEAIEVLTKGKMRPIDIAKAGDRYFTSGFALGRVPESIHQVTSDEKSKLHVLLIEDLSLLDTAKILPDFLKGDVASSDHLTYFATRKMKVTPVGEEHYESDLDGEKGPKVPFTVEVLKAHLNVLAPEEEK